MKISRLLHHINNVMMNEQQLRSFTNLTSSWRGA